MTNDSSLKNLPDRPLLAAAKRLASEERRATAALLRALIEIDRRRLYLGEGCASMFAYCTQVLRLAEGAAYNRIEAARAAREYPLILEFHHVEPYAAGGAATIENIELRCGAHNVYEARQFFADDVVRERRPLWELGAVGL